MNPEEQTVTWLISLGVLSSPKKNIADPEEFLKTSLKDGVVLCKLSERLVPGFTPKVSYWFKLTRVNKCQTIRRRWKEGRGLMKVIPTRTSPSSRPLRFCSSLNSNHEVWTAVCDRFARCVSRLKRQQQLESFRLVNTRYGFLWSDRNVPHSWDVRVSVDTHQNRANSVASVR